jgi:uncharacterized membrane protein YoaK (UPF0700 family)
VFLALGKVFTAFQSGNLVFLGIALADAGGPDVTRAAGSLAVFAAGVLVATRLARRGKDSGVWSVEVSLTLSLVCLAQIVFAIGWIASDGRPGTGTGDLLVALSALAMGLQSGAVLSLGVQGVFTTAATATVMFLMRDEAQRDSSAPERWRLPRVLLALVAGATAGGLLLTHARTEAPLLPIAATSVVIVAAHQLIGRAR